MTTPLMRSLLYVPGHNAKLVAKAVAGDADVIVLDLEDAVPPETKPTARSVLAEHCAAVQAAGKLAAVRVNAPEELLAQDLPAVQEACADCVILPKVESRADVAGVADRLEGTGSFLIGLIETPSGLLNVDAIAAAHPRLRALSLGSEDLAFEMQMTPCWDSLLVPSMQINIACKTAGIDLLGYVASIAEFRDLTVFENHVMRSVPLGFAGGFAIHPAQVAVLNRAFSPSAAEIDHARRVVAEFFDAKGAAVGAISVDGKMIDLPVARRAQRMLERQALITERQLKHDPIA
ncbi:HpcH/HpaI aldolase/citrate lyase family protein [Halomonas smyrnensis]|uniref:HpcH/HpaI aldolase/citrate lyase family protein n=1 Tax=Halomonas smyrnensis TaxID=720605 RepID=UPI0002FBEC04|nr:CoA ester lyase [Halomonas smyrnensis]